jgi:recombinational DNA repair ATPase RecF
MKLLELEIEHIRGIQHLVLKPGGQNLVVWGPNGSGKSAVVDAIDFLLTGRILRLTGKGTGCLSLGKHGPHIDCKPEESSVRGVIQLRNNSKPIELKRSMAEPKKLYHSEADGGELDRVRQMAEQGVHILSRREILKYITAEASTRAQEIQELLSIAEVEEDRKSLVKVKNDTQRRLEEAQNTVARAKARLTATTQDRDYDEVRILEVVNRCRGILGAQATEALDADSVQKDVGPPKVVSHGDGLNVTLLSRDIQNLQKLGQAENQGPLAEADERLRGVIREINAAPEMMRTLKSTTLIKQGIGMIDESGRCPLCDKAWPPGKLLEYLKGRMETARIADKYLEEIAAATQVLSTSVNRTIASLERVTAAADTMTLKDALAILRSWLNNLRELLLALKSPVESYVGSVPSTSGVKRMLAPVDISEVLANIEKTLKEKYPESTPEQTAWDMLTRLKENLGSIETAQSDEKQAQLHAKRAVLLHDHFLSARDTVLSGLYESIKDNFVALYRELHAEDEKGFSALIEPEEAGLNIAVDFYGRGVHPPHALHSEGHQDSMGLCLFLALAEYLTTGLIDLIVLDDVVMSVDAGHRRRVCHLLAKHFPDRQFLITTHDRTWANQLRSEGVVQPPCTVEFYNWSLELGPQVNCNVDLWQEAKKDMDANDVPSAAQKLRRGCEEYFGEVCDALRARVRYRLDGRWELEDLLAPAMSQYRELLKKAKAAAQSWEDKESFDRLQELDSTVGQIFTRSQVERWAVNASVHYSNWANLSKEDFRPVIEAFEDLCGLFTCPRCRDNLHVATKGSDFAALKCNCGAVNWNLVAGKKNVA